MQRILIALLLLVACVADAQQKPTPAAAAWWRLTSDLASDSMQGRDTGSAAYERAAVYVANHFKADGLKPAGADNSFFQRVPMHELDLDVTHSSIEIVAANGSVDSLKLLYEATIAPRAELPVQSEHALVFTGYGDVEGLDLRGRIAVFFNGIPTSVPAASRAGFGAARMLSLARSGAAGFVAISNPAATEPAHWPTAYAHTVKLADALQAPAQPTAQAPALIGVSMSEEGAARLFRGSAIDPHTLFGAAEKGLPLKPAPLPARLRVKLSIVDKEIASSNILAVLPGSDPTLAAEYVALSAHLDGYGFGTPVLGDSLYNGALDDAAYVATLLELAHTLSAPGATRPRRSLLFCIFTGEEKGLLGSDYFTHHPTVPIAQIVADLNLDQLRPIFPLKILTMEGIADSTLGDTARRVAAASNIELRPDREIERDLFRRADHFNFVRAGVPIASFIFGYDAGTPAERTYRDWYARRYHKPQDDLLTPIVWEAAVAFNHFYRDLALAVANAAERPRWLPSSAYAPHPQRQAP